MRLLVIGESWAADGKELPELPDAIAARLHRPVRACAIGYPGASTSELRKYFGRDYPTKTILALLGGDADEVILLNGVNDQVRHIGATRYADNTAAMVADTLRFAKDVQVMELPMVETAPKRPWQSRMKDRLLDWTNDSGLDDVRILYRRALSERYPGVATIDFDAFSPGYEKDRMKFQSDGMHLTPTAFHQYGAYIGSRIALPAD